MLRTHGLTKRFGGVVAVDDVDFELAPGELCSLIGPNGAGKTTFFNLLTGTLPPSEGRIELLQDGVSMGDGGSDSSADSSDSDGEWRDITEASPDETARMGLHRSYQITSVFPTSTVLENVRIAAQAHGEGTWAFWRNVHHYDEFLQEAHAILDRVGLADQAEVTAQNLSHGEHRQLEVAIALAGDPDVLLLDEPNAGVSSESVGAIVDLIEDVADDHAVLLVEHNMDIVMEVSERIVVLHQGQIIADDEPAAVRADPAVQEAYLGGYESDEDTSGVGDGTGDEPGEGVA